MSIQGWITAAVIAGAAASVCVSTAKADGWKGATAEDCAVARQMTDALANARRAGWSKKNAIRSWHNMEIVYLDTYRQKVIFDVAVQHIADAIYDVAEDDLFTEDGLFIGNMIEEQCLESVNQ